MIYVILGTKGQFVKMFPVLLRFNEYNIPYTFVHTSQHYHIIQQNRKRLGIRAPDIWLSGKKDDLKNITDLVKWAPGVLWNARKLPIKQGDYVINHGDTETTLITFFIGKYFGAKVVQVEAGLRSGALFDPFPEEMIRRFVSRLSDVCFCPYPEDKKTIGGDNVKIVTHGNTVQDSVRFALSQKPTAKTAKLLKHKKYILFLVHRKENVMLPGNLKKVLQILEHLLKKGYRVIWPVHTNTLYELKAKKYGDLLNRLKKSYDLQYHSFFDYIDFMHLAGSARFIASDGGGLQGEAFMMNKPMLVLRRHTDTQFNIGQTAYMSMLDMKRVNYFLKNYRTFKRKQKPVGSPSKVVADYFFKKEHGQ